MAGLRLHKILPPDLAHETATYLRASSLFSWATVFCHVLPSSPVDIIAIVPSGGIDRPELPLSYPRIQILIRGTGISTTMTRAGEVWKELTQRVIPLPGSQGRFVADHLPGQFYLDPNNRPVATLNFTYQGIASTA